MHFWIVEYKRHMWDLRIASQIYIYIYPTTILSSPNHPLSELSEVAVNSSEPSLMLFAFHPPIDKSWSAIRVEICPLAALQIVTASCSTRSEPLHHKWPFGSW